MSTANVSSLLKLENRAALVTGGGSGIGEGAARWLAKAGAQVALVGRDMADLQKVEKLIVAEGGVAKSFEADIADAESMQQVTDEAAKVFGRLDVLFANAGVNGVWAPIEELKFNEF